MGQFGASGAWKKRLRDRHRAMTGGHEETTRFRQMNPPKRSGPPPDPWLLEVAPVRELRRHFDKQGIEIPIHEAREIAELIAKAIDKHLIVPEIVTPEVVVEVEVPVEVPVSTPWPIEQMELAFSIIDQWEKPLVPDVLSESRDIIALACEILEAAT